jgi:hypothetical protein
MRRKKERESYFVGRNLERIRYRYIPLVKLFALDEFIVYPFG